MYLSRYTDSFLIQSRSSVFSKDLCLGVTLTNMYVKAKQDRGLYNILSNTGTSIKIGKEELYFSSDIFQNI